MRHILPFSATALLFATLLAASGCAIDPRTGSMDPSAEPEDIVDTIELAGRLDGSPESGKKKIIPHKEAGGGGNGGGGGGAH